MEPVTFTLAGVGAIALSEGIKFLYAEAGELLKRWLECKQKPGSDRELQVDIRLPGAFEGHLHPATISSNTFTENERALTDAYQQLSLYATDVKAIELSDTELLKNSDNLRSVLEQILGQSLTLKGELRPPSGTTVVRGSLKADSVSGDGAGIRAKIARSGLIEGRAEVEIVTEKGKVAGVEIDEIGS